MLNIQRLIGDGIDTQSVIAFWNVRITTMQLLVAVVFISALCASTRATCYYGDVMYQPGVIQLDECVSCMCDNVTSQLTCAHMTCPPTDDPACIRYQVPPGECCAICVEFGCRYDGEAYPRGTRIPLDPCQYCYCGWQGVDADRGLATCVNMTCVDMGCPGGRLVPNRCCPICPGFYYDEWTYQLGYEDDIVPYQLGYEDDSVPYQLGYEDDSVPYQLGYEDDSVPYQLGYEDDSVPYQLGYEDDIVPYGLVKEDKGVW